MRERGLEFSRDIRREVREAGVCQVCGRELEKPATHHCIPISFMHRLRQLKVTQETMDGYREWIRSRENALGVCFDCHQEVDAKAQAGQFYGLKRVGVQLVGSRRFLDTI